MNPQTDALAEIWDLAHDTLETDVSTNAALLDVLAAIRERAAEGLADSLGVFTPDGEDSAA